MDGGEDKLLLRLPYTLLRRISSISDEVDEDDEREAGLDLASEDVLDSILANQQ